MIIFEGERVSEGCRFTHTEAFGMMTPIISPVMNFLIFKVFFRKKANWQLIEDDMVNTSYGKKYITFYRAKRDISVLVKLCPRRNVAKDRLLRQSDAFEQFHGALETAASGFCDPELLQRLQQAGGFIAPLTFI